MPTTKEVWNSIDLLLTKECPSKLKVINNVYELPNIEPTIWYLHSAAGFSVKSTWVKAICNGNYITWPLVKVKNVSKFFPES